MIFDFDEIQFVKVYHLSVDYNLQGRRERDRKKATLTHTHTYNGKLENKWPFFQSLETEYILTHIDIHIDGNNMPEFGCNYNDLYVIQKQNAKSTLEIFPTIDNLKRYQQLQPFRMDGQIRRLQLWHGICY